MNVIISKYNNNICTLIINRPEHYNAINKDVLIALDQQLTQIQNNEDCRAVILTGSGDKAFIAGADIKVMSKMDSKSAWDFSKLGQDLTMKIELFHIPIIAAINGYALGGGCEFAIACHIRYASENAIFGQPETGLGLIAGFGGTQRLPRLVGKGRAMEILLGGKNISANDAFAMGLVNKVFPSEELLPAAEKLAKTIKNNAPLSIKATIRAINDGLEDDLISGLNSEQKAFSELFNSNDTAEGLSAFVEKRPPKFQNS